MKLIANKICRTFSENGSATVEALDNLNIKVAENEFVSIVGPSGCGKSSFLQMIAGLDQPDSGEILVDGIPVTEPGLDRGMVFQGYTLFPWLSVLKNVQFGMKKTNIPINDQPATAMKYVELVGLANFKDALPKQLSGGMRQRVALARALAARPGLLLMDEPFGALDAQTRLMMQALLLTIWEKDRTTVLFVTHDIEEAIILSDRVYVMSARPGKIKAEILINLPRPRRLFAVEIDPRFQELRFQLLDLIREEVESSF